MGEKKKSMSKSKSNENKADNSNNIIRYYVTVYLFYGFILFVFGAEIESFFKNISTLQEWGLFLIVLALAFHTLYIAILRRNITPTLRIINFVMSVTLFIASRLVRTDYLILSFRQMEFFALFFTNTVLFLSVTGAVKLTFSIRYLNKSITDPREKITLLIGFFGVLISLLTILK